MKESKTRRLSDIIAVHTRRLIDTLLTTGDCVVQSVEFVLADIGASIRKKMNDANMNDFDNSPTLHNNSKNATKIAQHHQFKSQWCQGCPCCWRQRAPQTKMISSCCQEGKSQGRLNACSSGKGTSHVPPPWQRECLNQGCWQQWWGIMHFRGCLMSPNWGYSLTVYRMIHNQGCPLRQNRGW